MNKGDYIKRIADKLVKDLKPFSKKIEIAGSIRRKEQNPKDIDIVIIPNDKEKIEQVLEKQGERILGGENKAYFKIKKVKVELYYTNNEEWGAALLAYSSKVGSAIGLRIVARLKGFKLNQHGLFKKGKRIAGKTEMEIYHALGRKWKKPEER